tara:strand:- start:1668 stop:2549 length:882 start_codon:yes stop_codon:yes gene_type:complete
MKLKIYTKAIIYLIRRCNIYPLRFLQKKIPKHIIESNALLSNCLKNIQNEGITSLDISSLIPEEEISKLYAYAEDIREGPVKIQKKSFIKEYIGGNYDDGEKINLNEDDPFLNLALNPFFLFLIKSYFKHDFHLIDIQFSETLSKNSNERKQSQRWHRDPAVRGLIKIFIYFSDVTKESGPFEYMLNTHNSMNLKPNKGPITTKRFGGSYYPDQNKLNKDILNKNLFKNTLLGPKGKIIIADTTGLHRGGFCEVGSRLMLTMVYYPKGDPWGSRIRINKKNKNLSKFQKSFIP